MLVPRGKNTLVDFSYFLLRHAGYAAFSYTAYQCLHAKWGEKILDNTLARCLSHPRPILLTVGALTLAAYEFNIPHQSRAKQPPKIKPIEQQKPTEEMTTDHREQLVDIYAQVNTEGGGVLPNTSITKLLAMVLEAVKALKNS